MVCIVWSRRMWRPSSVSLWPVIGRARTCGSLALSTTRFCATVNVNSRRWPTDRNKMFSIFATGWSRNCRWSDLSYTFVQYSILYSLGASWNFLSCRIFRWVLKWVDVCLQNVRQVTVTDLNQNFKICSQGNAAFNCLKTNQPKQQCQRTEGDDRRCKSVELCIMLLVVPGNSTAAWHVCSTLNYTGWTSLNEFSINWEWWSTGAYEARLRSTWWTAAALLRRILPVVSVSDPLPAISWTYHDIAAAGLDIEHSPSQVQGPGTCCLTISVIHHLASTLSDQRWKLTSSQRTGTRSAVEASCVMRFTNRQSSSSSSHHCAH